MTSPVRKAPILRSACIAAGALAILALWAGSSALYTLSEGQQALIVRLGQPVRVDTDPGLAWKLPALDEVIVFDTRLLLLEPPIEQIILGDQKRLEVQTYARFRIVDPLRFYQTVRTVEQARAQLAQLMSSSVRRGLGQVMLHALLSDERKSIVSGIEKEVSRKAAPLGIDVVEVRIHRADLPFETSQAIYDRMKSERQRDAKELRAQGFEWGQQIQAEADRERTIILSEAERNGKVIRGEGDAEANQILADAFGKDMRFFSLYRALQTYRQALAPAAPVLVLSPKTEFLRYFQKGPQTSDKAPDVSASLK